MKLVQLAATVLSAVLLISNCVPETEAIYPFLNVFVQLGYKLVKNRYYAKCRLRSVIPSGVECPERVYGVGLTRDEAQKIAKFFAVGSPQCAQYYGHCVVKKFRK